MKRVNLLPQHKQSELYYEDLYRSVTTWVILCSAILVIGILAQIAVWVYLEHKQQSIIEEVGQLQQQIDKSENAEVKQEIREINTLMTDFENLYSAAPQWSKVLKAFVRLVPAGVEISSFTADHKTGSIEISGYSPTREQVIELYNNINADKDHFKNINYPLENVAKPTDIQFNFEFFISDGVLVPKP